MKMKVQKFSSYCIYNLETLWKAAFYQLKICMVILIDKMQLSREFQGYRCNMKKIFVPSFS
jgi:hypothetical protein